jgi:hypothetical protein
MGARLSTITSEPRGISGSGGSEASLRGDGDGVDDGGGGQFSALSFFFRKNKGVHQAGNYLLHEVIDCPSSFAGQAFQPILSLSGSPTIN